MTAAGSVKCRRCRACWLTAPRRTRRLHKLLDGLLSTDQRGRARARAGGGTQDEGRIASCLPSLSNERPLHPPTFLTVLCPTFSVSRLFWDFSCLYRAGAGRHHFCRGRRIGVSTITHP